MAKNKGLTFVEKKKRIKKSHIVGLISFLFAAAITVFLAFVLVYTFGIRTNVIGVSMEPELRNGQEVLIDRLIYQLIPPKKGDVIVFLPNGNPNSHFYLKRVVAIPGEAVQIIGGYLYVDGVIAEAFDKMEDAGIAANEIRLRNNEFFVLGDNRNNSEDSRSGNIGVVSREVITGKAWLKLPFADTPMGFIE
ncbi:MAG: signal peptidase I [Lachnospiraceae bacterium]|jgi:signal peptidase I|nr:signal peptidase I [Lachnospiraceae bacterium]